VQEFSVENILVGIKDRDTKVLDFVYRSYFDQIKTFIIQNQGNIEDAQDIYQDAILVIYQKLQDDALYLSCSFSTYLHSVCRLLWLKQLNKRKKAAELNIPDDDFVILDDSLLEYQDTNERYKLYLEQFKRLSFSCQKVLELFLAGIPLREIARILGFRSEIYAKKRKHQCKEKLISNIKNDPRFHELSKDRILKIVENGKIL
jgi:RNA polymerase sigma factor (sigma-70 family)